MPDTYQGIRKMKKFLIILLSFVSIAIVSMAAVNIQSRLNKHQDIEEVHLSAQGKHCSGTVGCSCSGFKAKTDGKEWEKSYCKNCGHHKKYHH